MVLVLLRVIIIRVKLTGPDPGGDNLRIYPKYTVLAKFINERTRVDYIQEVKHGLWYFP